jgi:hypothetical protein
MKYTIEIVSDVMAHTKFPDDRFMNSGYIMGINSITGAAVVSVLQKRRFIKYIFELAVDGIIYIPSLIAIGVGIRIILKYVCCTCQFT